MPADLQILVRHIRRMAGRDIFAAATDRSLLDRYVGKHDEAAFATVVGRHAALVAGVCRRVLANTSDVEDAFQATFFVLARKAGAISWDDSVANWLHGVAYRIALRARSNAVRLHALHAHGKAVESSPLQSEQFRAMQELLDEELQRLPEAERKALVLCYLEGHTRDEAAKLCNWSLRTLDRKLDRGRSLLRVRLARGGFECSAVMLAASLSEQASHAGEKLTALALQFVRDQAGAAGGVATSIQAGSTILGLAETALPFAGVSYFKTAVVVLLVGAITTYGIGAYLGGQSGSSQAGKVDEELPVGLQNEAPQPQTPRRDLHGDPLPAGAIQRLGTTRFRPGGQIYALAVSPDGKWAVTGGQGTVRFWDIATGRPGDTLQGHHMAGVFSLAFSPDGKRLASADAEDIRKHNGTGKLIIWDLAAKRPLVTVDHPGWVRGVAFAPDGKHVAMCCDDGTLQLLDAATGKVLHSLGQPGRHSTSIAFSPDSQCLAGPGDNGALLWDVVSGQELRLFNGPEKAARTIALAPDGKIMATAHFGADPISGDATVCLWDVGTGASQHTLRGHKGMVHALAFSPNGKLLATGGANGEVLLWEVASGRRVRALEDGGMGSMHGVAFTPDGSSLVTGGTDGQIQIWDPGTGQLKGSPELRHAGLVSLALSTDGKIVAARGLHQPISLWDTTSGRRVAKLGSPVSSFSSYSLALAPVAPRLASAGKDGVVHLWDLTTGREENSLKADGASWAVSTTFSPSGKLLAVSRIGLIHLLDSETGTEIRRLEGHEGYVLGMAISPNEKLLASAAHSYGGDGKQHEDWSVRIWDLSKGVQLQRFPSIHAIQPAFHPNGRVLAYLSENRLICRDARTGQELPFLKDADVTAFAFSPSGTWMATAEGQGLIRVREWETGQEVLSFDARPAGVAQLLWNKDGKQLVSGNHDQTALVWDLSPHSDQGKGDGTERLEHAWDDLKARTSNLAYRAVWDLAAAGDAGVALIAKHMKPASQDHAEQIRKQVGELGDQLPANREEASKLLAKFGTEAERALTEALQNSTSLEVRTRAEALLRLLARNDRSRTVEDLQLERAFVVLELMGSARSRQLLEQLAGGVAFAPETVAAKQALERLGRRSTALPIRFRN